MALGSSAPEILLSLLMTLKDINAVPPVLGPATIVGSAAFNLLVISGVSIISVDEVKKISDLYVFAVTSIASLWAYLWMYWCLVDAKVTVTEAVLTAVYFVLLIVFAYSADRMNAYLENQRRDQEAQDEYNHDEEMKVRKDQLRRIAREYGDNVVIEVAQGLSTKDAERLPESTKREIKNLYCVLFDAKNVGEIDIS